MTGFSRAIEIEVNRDIRTVAFTADGEYLLGGASNGLFVWRVKDGKLASRLGTSSVVCLAVSHDGKWIASGSVYEIRVYVKDPQTFELKLFFAHKHDMELARGVDFSPDSTRLLSASRNGVVIWSVSEHEQVQNLKHDSCVKAVKYSPLGRRIATATFCSESVNIWDGDVGCLLTSVTTNDIPRGLLWFSDQLLVLFDNTIKQLDTSTKNLIPKWQVSQSGFRTCIALSNQEAFIAFSTAQSVTLCDTLTHSRLIVKGYPNNVHSLAFSPNDQLLAVCHGKNIVIESLNSIPLCHLHPTLQAPDFRISEDALNAWKHDKLEAAEAILTSAILQSSHLSHCLFASRAIVRTRMEQWDVALLDANMAINIQPSVLGYIAKSIAQVGRGERQQGYQSCDVAFERFQSSHGTFIRLIQAIIAFTSGEHQDAISRMDDLIATVRLTSVCNIVQAYMYLCLGNSRIRHGDFQGAIQSFEHVQTQMQCYVTGDRSHLAISLMFGWKFEGIDIVTRQSQCEALSAMDRFRDAVRCFHQLAAVTEERKNWGTEYLEWALDFRQRCHKRLAYLGDLAADTRQYNMAVSHYTTLLSLDPPSIENILSKRRQALAATESWKQALDLAEQMIVLVPSSPWGYEMKYATLHKARDYTGAIDAYETMLSKIKQHPNPEVQRLGDKFIDPASARAAIRKCVQRTIRRMPRVLIGTKSGRLRDKAGQAAAFESLPVFHELVSTMVTHIDYGRIKREVRQYYQYAMLSHKWEDNEPLYQQVMGKSVFELGKSPTHDKLQTFCKIVHDAGFEWAWSDTCCIDKSDHFVLQEALVAMFEWYQGSAMVIVFLRGVRSWSQLGALVASIWNTRAWTLQEYIAATVVHFYTEDWTPYLDLQLPNHKESSQIISEMEQATGVSAQQLMALRPGLNSIRDKLRLASTRHTTLVEDAAYSLLGIFSVSGIPAIYGEGNGSLGRLLAHIVTVSGDASTLAWTGDAGNFNSCLPAYITVYHGPATSHLPRAIPDDEMGNLVAVSHTSFDSDVALKSYHRLSELPAPWFAASRMKLPCVAFELPPLTAYRTRSGRVYRVNTTVFGMVEIKTKQDLSRMEPLYLVHPWLDTVLDRGAMHRGTAVDDVDVGPPPSPNTDDEEILNETDDEVELLPELQLPALPPPSKAVTTASRELRAQRLVARLRQPFGALLLTLATKGRIGVDYRRVAADSLVTVRFQESVSLMDLLENVCTFDVL